MNQFHYLQLQAAKGFGPVLQRRILMHVSEQNLTLGDFMTSSKDDWQNAGLSYDQVRALSEAEEKAKTWSEIISEQGIKVIGWLDDIYPTDLRRVLGDKAPPVLYLWGNLNLLQLPSVGFCGARNASEQGIDFARDTSKQIASKGWAVISGHARGIDHTAHKTALMNNGNTIIITPTGLFNFRLRADLRSQMNFEQVLILSEFQPNARWSTANAMTRNRTICGLSDAMIVVESGTTGGTFAAGKFALTVKIPLFVADYAHPAPSAAGNPYFSQRGAKPIRRSKETGRANLAGLLKSVENHQNKLASPPPAKLVQGSLFPSKELSYKSVP